MTWSPNGGLGGVNYPFPPFPDSPPAFQWIPTRALEEELAIRQQALSEDLVRTKRDETYRNPAATDLCAQQNRLGRA